MELRIGVLAICCAVLVGCASSLTIEELEERGTKKLETDEIRARVKVPISYDEDETRRL